MDLQSAKAEITSKPPELKPKLLLGEITLIVCVAGVIAFIFG